MSVRAWIAAARPLAHANIAPPILLGQAFAVAQGVVFDPVLAVVAFGFGVLDHLFIVFTNEYADREGDAHSHENTIFSGGSRVLVDGRLRPVQLRNAALLALGLLVISSIAAGIVFERRLLAFFAFSAIGLLLAYSVRPLALSYRGFGEILQAIGVGLVLPLLGYYVQAGELQPVPLSAFAPLLLLGFASNIVTSLPDVVGDSAAKKQTWPVRRGDFRARRDALVLIGVALLLVTQADPALEPEWTAVAAGPASLAALASLGWLRGSDVAKNRTACLRFVTFAVGAITVLQVSWAVALFLAP